MPGSRDPRIPGSQDPGILGVGILASLGTVCRAPGDAAASKINKIDAFLIFCSGGAYDQRNITSRCHKPCTEHPQKQVFYVLLANREF